MPKLHGQLQHHRTTMDQSRHLPSSSLDSERGTTNEGVHISTDLTPAFKSTPISSNLFSFPPDFSSLPCCTQNIMLQLHLENSRLSY